VELDVAAMRRAAFASEEDRDFPKVTAPPFRRPKLCTLTYEDRKVLVRNQAGRELLAIMSRKQTNLSFSADISDSKTLLDMVDRVGPYICLLKTHIDILSDFHPTVLAQLKALALKHDFLIFEDRKFADIGSTVQAQYAAGPFGIVDWAHLVNAHIFPGPDIVAGLKACVSARNAKLGRDNAGGGNSNSRGLLLLAEMSSRGHLFTAPLTQAAVGMALAEPEFVLGFIAQGTVSADPAHLHFTPGVQLSTGSDGLGQQYDTPASAVARGADVIIVGRGIYAAQDPAAAARELRRLGTGMHADVKEI
jgi:uridine monophosphate synthetase